MFSFLMCVNRLVPYLDEAIDSMLNQDYQGGYGIYIVANNCDSELWDYLNYKNEKTGFRISLHRTIVGQLAFNLNYGANLIDSMYVVRMDADDVSETNRLSRIKEVIESSNFPDVVGSAVQLIDESGAVIGAIEYPLKDENIKRRMPFRNSFIHPATAIKRETLLKVKGYANGLNSEDYDLWLRMIRYGVSFVNCEDKLVRYRINPYQVKGSRLGYAEVCAHILREFLITGKPSYLIALFFAVAKYVVKLPRSH